MKDGRRPRGFSGQVASVAAASVLTGPSGPHLTVGFLLINLELLSFFFCLFLFIRHKTAAELLLEERKQKRRQG